MQGPPIWVRPTLAAEFEIREAWQSDKLTNSAAFRHFSNATSWVVPWISGTI